MTVWMLPVDKVGDEWVVDDDPILDGDDMTKLEDVDHLKTAPAVCRGFQTTVYLIGETSGYVPAADVDFFPTTTTE